MGSFKEFISFGCSFISWLLRDCGLVLYCGLYGIGYIKFNDFLRLFSNMLYLKKYRFGLGGIGNLDASLFYKLFFNIERIAFLFIFLSIRFYITFAHIIIAQTDKLYKKLTYNFFFVKSNVYVI